MASKEATVYIVDVGASMGKQSHDRDVTDLDWALEYVWDKITTTVATDRKTALVGVIGLNTDGTQNELEDEEAYQHISVFQDLKQTLMPDLRELKANLKPTKTDSGDAISALVIAIQMITTHCRQLQYLRRIVLVTNGLGPMDTSDVDNIIEKVKGDKMELIILGVDFDDSSYGFQETDKRPRKAMNEKALNELAEGCNGVCGTLAQAIDELSTPRLKTIRPLNSYKGYLTLGNPEDYDTAMAIDIERYPRTMIAKPPTASSFVIRSDMAPGESTQPASSLPGEGANGDGLAGVKNARTYQVPDESAPGGKRDIEAENLAKGYAYGSTAVYISESDRNVTTYETKPGMDIIGFVDRHKYQRYLDMTRSNVIVAQRTNDKAAMALSSFIHALYELESYAVARLVTKENKAPQILLLAPSIESDIECLYDVELPFAEDVRSYRFPPLDRVTTISGKELKTHRNLPSDALVDAMSSYVDSMDLSTLGEDNSEYAPIDDTFSPILHRLNQVIRHRAIYAAHDLPPIPDSLTRYSQPPPDLVAGAKSSLDAVLAAADIKRVEPKQRGRRFRKKGETEKPMSGLDVGALLKEPATKKQRAKISAANAIPEFKQAADSAYSSGDMGQVQDVADQMGDIVRDYIRTSFGEYKYDMAVEAIRVLREESIEMEIFEWYNGFLTKLKGQLLRDELGGNREDMWWKIRLNRLGLITKKEVGASEIDDEAAREFLRSK